MYEIIQKTRKNSWFERHPIIGTNADKIFSNSQEIVVLQIILYDNFVVAEVVKRENDTNN